MMGNPNTGILHVVMWLGQTGTDSAGNTFPLVISSHDNTPAIFDTLALTGTGFPSDGDIAGHLPPPGVHILPFDASNWFYQDFQVAMRVIAVPEPSTCAMAVAALACGGCSMWRRLARALDLLKTDAVPLAAVAIDLGVSSQSHFTRLFSDLVGMTPARYRRQCTPIVG